MLVIAFLCTVFAASIVTSKPPNIVLILTDDQDTVLHGMTPLVKTKKLIGEKGITFENMFVTSPLCCPSRSSILTGKYTHNHHAINNSINGNCSSKHWQQGPEKRSVGTFLKALNYTTFFAGKYLNQYGRPAAGGPQHVPPGWDNWYGLVGNSKYYDYTLSVNGKPERHGDDYKKDYLTDVILRYALTFLQDQAGTATPFFMFLSTPACHEPFTPAPQYRHQYSHRQAPRTASFNKPGGQKKHWLIRHAPNPMAISSIEYLDDVFRNRWRTLLSVDDLVEQVVTTLSTTKQLENTYVIYTSDNGYHLGQFSLPTDKRQLYEFDIRVPFLMAGPGIPANKFLQNPILNIDIAPTIIELAGGKPPETMDGRSIVPLLDLSGENKNTDIQWRTDFLVQHVGEGKENVQGCPMLTPGFESCKPNCVCEDCWNNTYTCIRTLSGGSQHWMFCQFQDQESFMEFYDLNSDPHQLLNIVDKVDRRILAAQQKRLQELLRCAGESCRRQLTIHKRQHFTD